MKFYNSIILNITKISEKNYFDYYKKCKYLCQKTIALLLNFITVWNKCAKDKLDIFIQYPYRKEFAYFRDKKNMECSNKICFDINDAKLKLNSKKYNIYFINCETI